MTCKGKQKKRNCQIAHGNLVVSFLFCTFAKIMEQIHTREEKIAASSGEVSLGQETDK